MNLIIPPSLAEKMDRALLTTEDAARTILHCEISNLKLMDEDTGDFIGHLRIGALTYWARYRIDDGAYTLVSIYCHRAVLMEAAE